MVFDYLKSAFKKETNVILVSLLAVWDKLKKVFVAIFSFFKNLANWFRGIHDKVMQKKPNAKGISLLVKNYIATGNHKTLDLGLSSNSKGVVINTYYDEDTQEILEEYTEVNEYESLDSETQEKFGDKEMLIIE
ncbi:hypothetical protein KRX57_01355 [Weeksellaceae bacterium TAE3-ERU29]|nr:hypothetical protein [Weeksellaceae bacterium TAE3-ERU29]